MKFGYFDDNAKEYVITTPDTPLPWINYLGSQDFFSLISNTCGGYSFYKDAKLLRITRYRYNNIPVDSNGKRLSIFPPDVRMSTSSLNHSCRMTRNTVIIFMTSMPKSIISSPTGAASIYLPTMERIILLPIMMEIQISKTEAK